MVEERLCFRAFWEERALPAGVRGPVEGFANVELRFANEGEAGLLGVSLSWERELVVSSDGKAMTDILDPLV